MFENKLKFLTKTLSKWFLLIIAAVASVFISLNGVPAVNYSSIKENSSNIVLEKVDNYYVPYVKKELNSSLFLKISRTPIDIINKYGFHNENGVLISDTTDENNMWCLRFPINEVVIVLNPENFSKIKSDINMSDFPSDLKCVVGKTNAIWFKDTKMFVPISNNIASIAVKSNDSSDKLFLNFMKQGEKYVVLSLNGNEIDFNASSVEDIEVLKENNLLGERAYFSNFYYFVTHYMNKIMELYGVVNGSAIIVALMILLFWFAIYVKVRRTEISENKTIELQIAKSEFANDAVKLEEEIKRITNLYSSQDSGYYKYTFVLFFVENYINLRIIGDYAFVRGVMFGNNDLGMPEAINLSNLFGLLSSNYLYAVGPVAILAAILFSFVIDKTSSLPVEENNNNSLSMMTNVLKFLQPVIFLFIFSSRSLFFLFFYSAYVTLKHIIYLVLLKIRGRNSVRFVK